MANTLPLLTIMDEKDRLAQERKIMDLIIKRFNGLAMHTVLLNYSHMRKREFLDVIASLVEREAITVENGPKQKNGIFPKMYRANSDILKSWGKSKYTAKTTENIGPGDPGLANADDRYDLLAVS